MSPLWGYDRVCGYRLPTFKYEEGMLGKNESFGKIAKTLEPVQNLMFCPKNPRKLIVFIFFGGEILNRFLIRARSINDKRGSERKRRTRKILHFRQ